VKRASIAAAGFLLALIGGCGRSSPERATHRVEIRAMRFDPAVIEVAPGDTVRWMNFDFVPHTATSGEGAFDSGNLPPDSSWAVVVARAGVMNYECRYHPGMKGTITARP
jgi:plastocyanin